MQRSARIGTHAFRHGDGYLSFAGTRGLRPGLNNPPAFQAGPSIDLSRTVVLDIVFRPHGT